MLEKMPRRRQGILQLKAVIKDLRRLVGGDVTSADARTRKHAGRCDQNDEPVPMENLGAEQEKKNKAAEDRGESERKLLDDQDREPTPRGRADHHLHRAYRKCSRLPQKSSSVYLNYPIRFRVRNYNPFVTM